MLLISTKHAGCSKYPKYLVAQGGEPENEATKYHPWQDYNLCTTPG